MNYNSELEIFYLYYYVYVVVQVINLFGAMNCHKVIMDA